MQKIENSVILKAKTTALIILTLGAGSASVLLFAYGFPMMFKVIIFCALTIIPFFLLKLSKRTIRSSRGVPILLKFSYVLILIAMIAGAVLNFGIQLIPISIAIIIFAFASSEFF